MRLPKTSRSYPAEIEEVFIGKGDYLVGGARSPAFLELDNARHRRPIVFGEVCDTLEGYPEAAAEMFSGRQNDPEEWAVMWKEIKADGICVRLTKPDSAGLVQRIADRTNLPVMVTADTDVLEKVASGITNTILILGCRDREQSIRMSSCSNNHVVVAACGGNDPQGLCREMSELGAKNIIVSHGDASMGTVLKRIRTDIESYRLAGINGDPDSRHPMVCDVTHSWDSMDRDVSPRRASMFEATVALAAIKAGTDMLVLKGPGAMDMARIYGAEMAGL